MTSLIREKLGRLFTKNSLPILTEKSSLEEIAQHYPQLYDFLRTKYSLVVPAEEKLSSLKTFVSNHGLPPPQVLFMEIQMVGRTGTVKEISPREASELLRQTPQIPILDVRESWELKMGSISKSTPLSAELLDEILKSWDREHPVLLYCHFGIRSLDAASFLADRGFKKVWVIQGGIDSWATEIDPTIPRYEGAYC